MLKRFFRFLRKPATLTVINVILVVWAFIANEIHQVFCNPVGWSLPVIAVCFTNAAFLPITRGWRKVIPAFGILDGISFAVMLYGALFLGSVDGLILVLVLFGIGVVVLTPHWLGFQLFWIDVIRPERPAVRWFFVLGVVMSLGVGVYAGQAYYNAVDELVRWQRGETEEWQPNWWTERIVGMHVIYHTRVCIYDGWRPPVHDPLLVAGLMFNNYRDPLYLQLPERIALYRELFPDREIRQDCPCAATESSTYFRYWFEEFKTRQQKNRLP